MNCQYTHLSLTAETQCVKYTIDFVSVVDIMHQRLYFYRSVYNIC